MKRFDYLCDPRGRALNRIVELRIAPRFQMPLIVLTAAVVTLMAVYGIERHRRLEAGTLVAAYRVELQRSEIALRRAKVRDQQIDRLVLLDEHVTRIERSGDLESARLVLLANRLPRRSWLTSIDDESSAVTLSGRAIDLNTVGAVLARLVQNSPFANAMLTSANIDPNLHPQAYDYEVRSEVRP